jgi:hypothetical protein
MEISNKNILAIDPENNICPICHENIDFTKPESYIIFNCCNQMSHIKCIILWANSEFSRSSKSNVRYSCIMCQQSNDILRDIAQNITNNTDISINLSNNFNIHDTYYNDLDNNIDSENYNDLNEQNTQDLNEEFISCRKRICKIISCIAISIIFIPTIIFIIML